MANLLLFQLTKVLFFCLFGGVIIAVSGTSCVNYWGKTSAPNKQWYGIATNSSGGLVAAASNTDIQVSKNGGYSWQAGYSNPHGSYWNSITSDQSGQYLAVTQSTGGIYTSVNHGVNWTITSAPKASQNINWKSVASDASGQFLAAVESPGGIYTSSNNGITWSLTSAPSNLGWYGIASDFSGQKLAAAANQQTGIYLSHDNGKTWQLSIIRPSVKNWCVVVLNSTGEMIVAAQNFGGIYISTNSGLNWRHTIAPNASWRSIASDSSGQYLAAVENNGYSGLVHLSSDAGVQWTVVSSLSSSLQPNSVASDTTGQFLAVTMYEGYIYISNDSGKTWIVTSAPTNKQWYSIACNSSGQALIASSYNTGLYVSHDRGTTWILTSAPSFFIWNTVASDSTGKYLLGGASNGGIYISRDGGSAWQQTTAPSTTYWSFIASNSTGEFLVAVLRCGGIYLSHDRGKTWLLTTAPLEQWFGIASDKTGRYLAAAAYYTSIYTSTDGGNTWISTTSPVGNWRTIASDSTGQMLAAAQNSGGIYTSKDGGNTWKATTAPVGYYTSITSDSTGTYLAAVQYQIYTSSDGGDTWQLNCVATNGNWFAITSDYSGKHLYAAQAGSIYKQEYQPTSQPTSTPTWTPSAAPSSSPTAYPTFKSGGTQDQSIYTNNPSASLYFTQVGNESTNNYYLSVAVYPTGVQVESPFTIQISRTSGDPITISTCSVPSSCSTTELYYCFYNFDISKSIEGFIAPEDGGTIEILFTNINFASTCKINGYKFVSTSFLTKDTLIPAPTISPTISPAYVVPTSAPVPTNNEPTATTDITTDNEQVDLVNTNMPFIISLFLASMAALFGMVLISNRMRVDHESTLYHPKYITTILHFGLFISAYASQVFFIYVCFSHGKNFLWFGVALVALRVLSVGFSIWILYRLLQTYQYNEDVFDKKHFLQEKKMYTILFFLCLFDFNFIKYLSWKNTDYVVITGGFPNQFFFEACSGASITISMCISALQTAFTIYTSEANNDALEGFALVSLYFSFALSLTKTAIAIVELLLVKCFTKEYDDGTRLTMEIPSTTVENPVFQDKF